MIVQTEMQDPRVRDVTVTFTRMSRDMSTARIHFTRPGGEQAVNEAMKVLNKAAGFIRHELAGRVDLRYIPSLRFFHDASVERGRRVSELIDAAMAREDHDDDGESA